MLIEILQHCQIMDSTVKFDLQAIPGYVSIEVTNTQNKKSYSQSLPWDHITEDGIKGVIDFCIEKTTTVISPEILNMSVDDLVLSIRAWNVLKCAKISTLRELAQYDRADLMKFRNFGNKTIAEIENVLAEKGLTFGMILKDAE